ncbi:ATP synthase F1 subunit epsilon [Acidithiobacillus acidisediminis]|uniref:ATP synthase F1 subunit epsilon n=1 Tax=Acidithiobacillus TaxID=119977 RepID=UPI00200F69BC|nr:ATP synthase F1 subunit epsilon [Acidithiobacillus sp. S30A2]
MNANRTFSLSVVDVNGLVYSGDCTFVVLPGELGELGIFARHAPLLSILQAGELRAHFPDGLAEVLFIEGGFAEIQPSGVMVLADVSLRIPDLNPNAIKKGIEKAKEAVMQNKKHNTIDFIKAEQELQRELAKYRSYTKYTSTGSEQRQEYNWQRPTVAAPPKINPAALED